MLRFKLYSVIKGYGLNYIGLYVKIYAIIP